MRKRLTLATTFPFTDRSKRKVLLFWVLLSALPLAAQEYIAKVEHYSAMRAGDFIPVVLTVIGIGLLAALPPVQRAVRVPAFLREE